MRERLRERLQAFAESGAGDVRALRGREGARLRVGDWRVIFVRQGESIVVVAAGHRREIYE